MITLDEYLAIADARPWQWGRVDCLMRPADWVQALTGVDPAAAYRGAYSTALGAWRLVAAAGGMVAIVGAPLERLGWRRTDTPDTGDIGVVLAPSQTDGTVKEVGALRYGPWWTVRGLDDVTFAELPTVAAWTLSKA